jgi:hypothetical protein
MGDLHARPTSQRIRGEDVQIQFLQDNHPQDTIVDVQDFEVVLDMEVISKAYLGETSERKDYRYKGAKFNGTLHCHTQDYLAFALAIKAKAQRDSTSSFVITGSFNFPNGDRPTFHITDPAFGPIPISVKGQAEYVETKLEGEADDIAIDLS